MELSRNNELLLYCLRVVKDETGDRKLEELSSLDWDVLFEESRRYGIAPFLYHRLRTFNPAIPVPASMLRKLGLFYLQNSARNIHLYQELGEILKLLRHDSIPVIALKGVHLAADVYQDIALRPMGDIDLLVKQSDLLKVQEILLNHGYISLKEEDSGFCFGLGSAHVHLPMFRKEDSIPLEIHFHIIGPPFSFQINVEKLWIRAHMTSLQGIEVLTLCPEDLLLHLCMHVSFHHGFDNGIRPLFDISQTIDHYGSGLDWEQVLDRSKEWGVDRCVYVALSLAKKLSGASIPECMMKDLDVHNEGFTVARLAEELLFTKDSPIAPNIAMLFDNKSLLDRLIHFFRCVFPPKTTMTDTHFLARNPLSAYSFYCVRIKDLLKRHGQTAWRLLLHDRETSAYAKIENKRNALRNWLTQ